MPELLCLSHNNVSQSEKCIVSWFWWLEVQDQVVSRFMLPLKVLEKYLFQTSLKLRLQNLQLTAAKLHMTSLCVYLCVQISPFYKDTQSYQNMAQPKELALTKDTISKKGRILRYMGQELNILILGYITETIALPKHEQNEKKKKKQGSYTSVLEYIQKIHSFI